MSARSRFLLLLVSPIVSACQRETANPPAAPTEVLVQAAGSRDVPVYREWVGTLDGSENAEIRARVTGYLLTRRYQEGALVKKGDVLFEIDPRPFEAALAEAGSQLAQAKAIQIASQAEFERDAGLVAKKAVSEREYTTSKQRNEANLARIQALEAGEEQAKLNLGFCKVISPVDGIAGIARVQVGDLVGTGDNAVLTSVSTLDPIKIICPISEAEYLGAAEKIRAGLSKPLEERGELIELILGDGKPYTYKCRLLAVDLGVKANTGTILVTALTRNPGNTLRPGLFARARIVADTLTNAVVVPQRAVGEVQSTFQIGVVGADGKAEIRHVVVGPRTGSEWVITSGLKAGEIVIVEGMQKVRSGGPVSSRPWTPPPSLSTSGAASPSDRE